MYLEKFGNFQKNHQCLALALCFLLLNQQVLGKDESRRRYESPFKNFFEKGKNATQQLVKFYFEVKDDKALQQNTDRVMAFVKANPDKVAIGIGLVSSSWLLYQSILLGGEIEGFFDEIDELKGLFNDYYLKKVPVLEAFFRGAREYAIDAEPEKQKDFLKAVYQELMTYYNDLQKIIDKVDDVIADVNNAKIDAVINTALSGTVAVLACAAIVAGGPVTMSPEIWKAGVVATMGISTASTTLSLKNAHDLKKASKRLKTLKHDLRRLREHVMEKMIEVITFA